MSQSSTQRETLRAAAWLLMGVLGGLGLDLCAKQILEDYSLLQFVLVRSVVDSALGVIVIAELAWTLLTMAWFYHRKHLAPLVLVHAVTNGAIWAFVVLYDGHFRDGDGNPISLYFFL